MKVKIFRNFYWQGLIKSSATISIKNDTSINNSKILKIDIDKGLKFKINEIIIEGNSSSDEKIKRLMKETKESRV